MSTISCHVKQVIKCRTKKYHTVGPDPKSNKKIVERCKIDTSNKTHKYMTTHFPDLVQTLLLYWYGNSCVFHTRVMELFSINQEIFVSYLPTYQAKLHPWFSTKKCCLAVCGYHRFPINNQKLFLEGNMGNNRPTDIKPSYIMCLLILPWKKSWLWICQGSLYVFDIFWFQIRNTPNFS